MSGRGSGGGSAGGGGGGSGGGSGGGGAGGKANKSGTSQQALSLPSGGGALSGTGGSYMTDMQTGAGNYTVPIDVPDGRNGHTPSVKLSYSTGNPHGVCGMGWTLSTTSVDRDTKRGLPRYAGDDDFALAGSRLVEVDERSREDGGTDREYRPRIEGEFGRVVRSTGPDTDHWTVEKPDGTVRRFGTPGSRGSDPATVADPDDGDRVFSWNRTESVDPHGNRIRYEYESDAADTDQHRFDRPYLAAIRYAEKPGTDDDFLVSVEFEYEPRPDPYSRYKAGFEVRTRKRLSRVVVRTHADRERTVRSYELTYRDEEGGAAANGVSQLASVREVGHDDGDTQARPPVEFEYATFDPDTRDLEAVSGSLPGRPLSTPELELADLNGDGLPDVVEIDDGIRYWRNLGDCEFDDARPMEGAPGGFSLASSAVQLLDADGDGRIDLASMEDPRGYFPLQRDGGWSEAAFRGYDRVPGVDVDSPAVKTMDLTGDGATDLVRTGSNVECFFQDPREGWTDTRTVPAGSFDGLSAMDFTDPRIRVADATGDGLQDVVYVESGHVSYWPNLGYGEWGPRVHMRDAPELPTDHDPGRVLLGDVDGDGTADVVYVEDGRVRVWLNRTGGCFSDPIELTGTPRVTDADAVRLVDLKGAGIGGLLYGDPAGPDDEMYFLELIGDRKPYLLTEARTNLGARTEMEYEPSTASYLASGEEWETTLPQPTWTVSAVETVDELSGRTLTREYDYYHGHWDGAEREFRGFGRVDRRDTRELESYGEGVDTERLADPSLTRTWFHVGPVGPEHGDWEELEYDGHWSGDPDRMDRPPDTRELLDRIPRRHRRDAVAALAGRKLRTEVYGLDGPPRADRPYEVVEYRYGVRQEAAPEGSDRRVFFPHSAGSRTTKWERGDDPKTTYKFTGDFDAHGQSRLQVTVDCPRKWDPGEASDGYRAEYSRRRYADPVGDGRIHNRVAETVEYDVVLDRSLTVPELRRAIERDAVPTELSGLTRRYYDGPAFEGRRLGEVGDRGQKVREEKLALTDAILALAYPDAPATPGDGGPAPGGGVSPDVQAPPDGELRAGDGTIPYLSGSPTWSEEYPRAFVDDLPERAGYVVGDVSAYSDRSGAETGYFVPVERAAYDFQTGRIGSDCGLKAAERDPLGREVRILAHDEYGMTPLTVESPSGLVKEATYDYSALSVDSITDHNDNETRVTFTPLGLVASKVRLGDPGAEEGDTPAQPSVFYEYDFTAYLDSPPEDPQPAYVHTVKRRRHRWDVVERAREERGPLSDADVAALFENERERFPERFVESRTYSDGFGNEVQTRSQAEAVVFEGEDGGPVLAADPGGEDPDAVVGRDRSADPGTAWSPDRSGAPRTPGDAGPAQGSGSGGSAGDAGGSATRRPEGRRVRVSDWKTYDDKGNPVEEYDPFFDAGWSFTSRAEAHREHPTAFERKTETEYDPMGRTVRKVQPNGATERTVRGDPSPDLSTPGEYEPTPWVTYTYSGVDEAGRTHPSAAADYRHRWDTPSSDERRVRTRESVAVERNRGADAPDADPVEHRTVTRRYPGSYLRTITDQLGRVAYRQVKDLMGRTLRTETQDAGTSVVFQDAAGNPLERRDAKGSVVLQRRDGMDRTTHVWARDDDEQSVTLRRRVVYGEDAPGLDADQKRARNLLGEPYRTHDGGGVETVERYDFRGNPERKRHRPLADDVVAGGPVDWSGGSLRDRRRALCGDRTYETAMDHDAIGRIQTRRYPTDVTGTDRELRFEYTPSGSLTGLDVVEDPDGAERTETYLAAVGYDAEERRSVVVYGNGLVTRRVYDEVTRRLRRVRTDRLAAPDGGTAAAGPAGQGRAPDVAHRYELAGPPFRDTTYEYDVAGAVLSVRERAPGSGVKGAPQQVPSGGSIAGRDELVRTYEYDALKRLTAATGRECTSAPAPRSWGSQDLPWSESCGHGGVPSVNRRNAPDQTALYTEEYDYDPADNLTRLRHTRHTSSGAKTWTRSFGYAGAAPADWDPSPGDAPGESNALTHVGDDDPATGKTHSYDARGNLVAERNARYEFDRNDMLRTYRERKGGSTSVAAHYAYSKGQRTKKVVDKPGGRREVTEYVDGVFEYRRLETGSDVREYNAVHVTDSKRRVAIERVGTPFEGGTFADADHPAVEYQLSDHLDSATVTVDGSGGWINYEEYTPFGETTFGGYARKRYRYTGKERDEESGLYYHGQRYYAPWLCRWTTTDPGGPKDGLNLYPYVGNDPVNRSDPSGKGSEESDQCNGDVERVGGKGWTKAKPDDYFGNKKKGKYKSGEQKGKSLPEGTMKSEQWIHEESGRIAAGANKGDAVCVPTKSNDEAGNVKGKGKDPSTSTSKPKAGSGGSSSAEKSTEETRDEASGPLGNMSSGSASTAAVLDDVSDGLRTGSQLLDDADTVDEMAEAIGASRSRQMFNHLTGFAGEGTNFVKMLDIGGAGIGGFAHAMSGPFRDWPTMVTSGVSMGSLMYAQGLVGTGETLLTVRGVSLTTGTARALQVGKMSAGAAFVIADAGIGYVTSKWGPLAKSGGLTFIGTVGAGVNTIAASGKGLLDVSYLDTLVGTEIETSDDFRRLNHGMKTGEYGSIVYGWSQIGQLLD